MTALFRLVDSHVDVSKSLLARAQVFLSALFSYATAPIAGTQVAAVIIPAVLIAPLLLTACGSMPSVKPQSPNVSVAGVRPLDFTLTSQTIGLTLLVENPNSFDLPMQSLTFNARFSGEQFAQGASIDEVVIPANGEALLEVEVKTGLGKLATQLRSMLNTNNAELNYDVTGLVKLSNWPKAIPFNVEGELEDPRKQK